MKRARYLSVSLLALFAFVGLASADPSSADLDPNPYTKFDADGVPVSLMQPQASPLSQAEIATLQRQQAQAILDKNWLVRGYEQQLKAHADGNSTENEDTNLYYQLSTNKELAKLAGLPELDSDDQDTPSIYRATVVHPDPSSVTLRPDNSSSPANGFASHGDLFKPLVTPLGAPDAAGLHNFYSSDPYAPTSSFSGLLPRPSPIPNPDQSADTSDLQIPGLVAAGKNPHTDTDSTDLTLDILPGETAEQAKTHQDSNASLDLPLPMDADQLHKQEAATIGMPDLPKSAQKTVNAPAPAKPTSPLDDPEAPIPASEAPHINPVRAPIANPYDILNR